ncbi:MprA: response regulator protein [Desulfosarcina variabilis str. Montpellier]|uniref:response regulator n=1 Tax=Desulfosarcina variabilis TaxID=2300 RepID=UPI003AFB30F3
MQSSKGTIMVVDDSLTMRHAIRNALEPHGYTVVEAENGVDGLLRTLSYEKPDLITLDIEMPEMDGISMCRNIRKISQLDELPIIFLTSMADQKKLLKVFQAGATDYLIKPFLKEELLARLRVHLEKSRLIRKLRSTVEQLNAAERVRAEKDRLQGVVEMAGAVCHELNQPIQSVSGYAELMMMKADDSNPLTGYAQKIATQVDRMGKITGKLMNVTTYRTKQHDPNTRIIDIDEATGNVL